MTSGHQLSDILLTMSDDFRLGRWSLYDGTLVWSKTLGGEGSDLKDLVSVYYDQAVLIVDSSRIGSGLSLSVSTQLSSLSLSFSFEFLSASGATHSEQHFVFLRSFMSFSVFC